MKNILIVENGKTVSKMLSEFLAEGNFKILKMKNLTKEVMNLFPDLIIADLTTVKNENVELLILLKSSPFLSFVPFIAITSGKIKQMRNIRQEFKYQLSKPFDSSDLIQLIKKIVEDPDKISPW